jgi:hypothetical protein
VATSVAVAACEAVGEDSAAEIGPELLFDILGKRASVAFARVGEERFQVIAHDAVEDRLGGTAGEVWGGKARHAPLALRGGVPGLRRCNSGELPRSRGVHARIRVAWDSSS